MWRAALVVPALGMDDGGGGVDETRPFSADVGGVPATGEADVGRGGRGIIGGGDGREATEADLRRLALKELDR